jgi:opacity protein-like surface antigen
MKKTLIPIACSLLALASSASAAVVLEYNFDSTVAPFTGNGQVVGLTATTASTGESVLRHTSGSANADPQINLDNGVAWLAPGAGETWVSVTIRSRKFDSPDPNTDPQLFTSVQNPWDNVGTLLINKGGGAGFFNYLPSQSNGTPDANGWTITTYDVSTRGSTPFDNLRFDFVEGGNHGIEVDWVRFSDTAVIPEPSSFALLGFAGLGLLARRKR